MLAPSPPTASRSRLLTLTAVRGSALTHAQRKLTESILGFSVCRSARLDVNLTSSIERNRVAARAVLPLTAMFCGVCPQSLDLIVNCCPIRR